MRIRSGKRMLAALMGAASLLTTTAARPPNVLICVTDDQSFPHASAYGTRWVRTPAFDRVAREGLLFTNAFTPNAKCGPSRAILLTSRQSWQLGAAANHVAYYPEGKRTFMEALGGAGFAVGYTGKGWAPGDPGRIGDRPRELTGKEFNEQRWPERVPGLSPIDYAANFAEFLRARERDQPFCFWFGAMEPHRPYARGAALAAGRTLDEIDRVPAYWPDNDTVRSDLLDYAREIEFFDAQLARFLALLEEHGELDRTLIIVTSDNGMPFPRAKGTTYDASMHIPLAMRWPGGIARAGRQIDALVSLVDLAPTILEATAVDAKTTGMEAFAGTSLGPLMRDEHDAAAGRDALIFGQERHDLGRPGDKGYPVRGIIRDGFLYARNLATDRWPMGDPITGYLNTDGGPTKSFILEENRHGRNHWLWELNFGRRPAEELYDLARDPDCLRNLSGELEHAPRREAMAAELMAELRRQDDPRVVGAGNEFDRYPYASPLRGFYERFVRGERPPTPWIESTDFEPSDFDPERPLRPRLEP